MGDDVQQANQQQVGEAVTACRVCRDGGIFDRRILACLSSIVLFSSPPYGHLIHMATKQLDRIQLTEVVRTPQSSGTVWGAAAGVWMNSNSSGDSG